MVTTTAATTAGVTTTTTAITTDARTRAATATMASQSLAIAPDQGDADHREKDRDAKQQSTIHP
jgi:hypothetical protein